MFSSGSWSVNVLQGKLNSDGESYLPFNTFRWLFLPFKRIVSRVGKSYMAIESVKLLAFNTHSDIEVFVGQRKRGKTAGTPSPPVRPSACFASVARLSVVCRAVSRSGEDKEKARTCAHGAQACWISSVLHKNQQTSLLLSKYNFQRVKKQ